MLFRTLVIALMVSNVIAEKISVLIVDGFSNHDWAHTTELLQAVLENAGGFNVEVSTFPGEGEDWDPGFQAYDVVVQNCNDIKGGERWPRAVETALDTYVKNGGGLYAFHSANNAFPHWAAYNRMIGLGWRKKDFGSAIILADDGSVEKIPAGKGENTGHGKRVDTLVTRIGEHPVHTGLPRQWMAADIEVYRYARGPADHLTVLSFARDEKTGLNFPVEWTVEYGKGKVYTSTLGHVWHDQDQPEGMMCAGHQALIPRVVTWLAGREIVAEAPAGFPTENSTWLRPLRED